MVIAMGLLHITNGKDCVDFLEHLISNKYAIYLKALSKYSAKDGVIFCRWSS